MFGEIKCVLNVHSEITDRALNFGVSQQKLDRRRLPVALYMIDAFVRRIECVP
jgi:hypothetical protein